MTQVNGRKSNKPIVLIALAMIGMMTLLVSFAVPLYSIFCQVTGYGGTTQRAEAAGETVIDRQMVVRFNADTDPQLPWTFRPVDNSVTVTVGEPTIVNYYAKNLSDKPVTGHAVFNVTPQKAGLYFSKIACFCFTEQTLQPGEEVKMPVRFFIDPDIAEDGNLDDVRTMTLSYTFYRSDSQPSAVETSSAATGLSIARAGAK